MDSRCSAGAVQVHAGAVPVCGKCRGVHLVGAVEVVAQVVSLDRLQERDVGVVIGVMHQVVAQVAAHNPEHPGVVRVNVSAGQVPEKAESVAQDVAWKRREHKPHRVQWRDVVGAVEHEVAIVMPRLGGHAVEQVPAW